MWERGDYCYLLCMGRLEVKEMIYTFRCNVCHYEFEKDLKLVDVANAARPPKIPCPNCKGSTRKLINRPSIKFIGSGFYSTDNKK